MLEDSELIIMPFSNFSYCKAIYKFRTALMERAHEQILDGNYSDEEKEFSKRIMECNNQMNEMVKKVFYKKTN